MLNSILTKEQLMPDDLLYLLKLTNEADLEKLFAASYAVKEQHVGTKAYFRGLIELSNICVKDCYYCGIRKGNKQVPRFETSVTEALELAQWAYDNEYGSVVLQSGERQDSAFVQTISHLISGIKEIGASPGLGITLCLGEQTPETYREWFKLGAHRYLLRIETSNKKLYKQLHPNDGTHSFEQRVDCLTELSKIGYQVGTGVMIGLPGQTEEDLVNDILFYEKMDIAMVGMGPYVVHKDTPMGGDVIQNGLDTEEERAKRLTTSLKMIAATRLYLKDINIAATTALQALHPLGREMGLKAGANILMPIITLPAYRSQYQLYDNKPCIDDTAEKCKECLTGRVLSTGDSIGFGEWGDSVHFNSQSRH